MKYPYFVYPAICELKQNPKPEKEARLKQFVAANVGDFDALRSLIGEQEYDFRKFYDNGGAERPSTEDTIDSFISKFGKSSDNTDTLLPEEGVTTDYFAETGVAEILPPELEIKEKAPVIEEETTAPEEKPASNADEEMEKAKILVKNRDYKGALEIMEAIYLNNPKKSIYFADQIRFVRKLAANESKKSLKS